MRQVSLQAGQYPHRVWGVATKVGADLVVIIGGGDAPHIGAVALATARPSLADPEQSSASASVLCVTGHKEDELARSHALRLSSRFRCQVCVSAGIHVDDATPNDLRTLVANANELMESLEEELLRCGALGADC